MRWIEVSGGALFTLTDAVPAPAAWSYAFPAAHPADRPDVAARWLPDAMFRTRFAVTALQHEGRIVLVDAGLGSEPSPYFDGLSGRLPEEMRAARLDPAAVECVLFTHFHLDHIGWAADARGDPCFPNARYRAPATELAHWRENSADAALPHHVEAFGRRIAPLLRAGRLEAATEDGPAAALGPLEVFYRAAPGHTAGHHVVVITGARDTILIAGDAWHSPAQIAVPDWCHRADRDPAAACQSRTALMRWACDEGTIVMAGHFPEDISIGQIRREGADQFAFVPTAVSFP